MTSIVHPKFYSENCKLHFSLEVAPAEKLKIKCTIKKVEETWVVTASAVHIQINSPAKFKCKLPSITLKPAESRVMGVWIEVFQREDHWNIPSLTSEDNASPYELDPIKSLQSYANQDLLQITAYENGITVKSDYLKLKEN